MHAHWDARPEERRAALMSSTHRRSPMTRPWARTLVRHEVGSALSTIDDRVYPAVGASPTAEPTRRGSRTQAPAVQAPGSVPSGASQAGRERASSHPDAEKGERARDQAPNMRQRQVSPDRTGHAAPRGARRPQRHYRSQIDASGSPRAASSRPRGGEPGREGWPWLSTQSRRLPGRRWPRAARRSPRPTLCAGGQTRPAADLQTRRSPPAVHVVGQPCRR
jgi:hypothetical protein